MSNQFHWPLPCKRRFEMIHRGIMMWQMGQHSVPRGWSTLKTSKPWMEQLQWMWPQTVSLLGFAARISKGKLEKYPPSYASPILPHLKEKEGRVWAWGKRNCTRTTAPKGAARNPQGLSCTAPDLALLKEMCLLRDVNPLGPPGLSKQERLITSHAITGSVG